MRSRPRRRVRAARRPAGDSGPRCSALDRLRGDGRDERQRPRGRGDGCAPDSRPPSSAGLTAAGDRDERQRPSGDAFARGSSRPARILRSCNAPATAPTTASGRRQRRGLTGGLVLTITLVAFEALAVSTVMPIVASELGGMELYGWVFTAFFLGSLIGIAVVGGIIDRGGLGRPFALGLGLFAIGLLIGGLAPSMPILVVARFIQGLGAGTIPPIAYVAIGRSLPEPLRPRMFATLSTAWVLPGVIGPALAGLVGESLGWRYVFLGLLPFIAVAGLLTIRAIAAVAVPATGRRGRGRGRLRPSAAACRRPARGRSAPA